jgi:hypothetical protein
MMVPQERSMNRRMVSVAICLALMCCVTQAQRPLTVTHQDQATFFQAQSKPNDPATNPSGMYTFLKEGEFVQLTLEDGQLSGFVSRFGETESDKGEFIDQFFEKASLDGNHLYFKTRTVHALWYEFDGMLNVVSGKHLGDEGYRVIRGKLTLHAGDAKGHEQASQKTVEFKSFPADMRRP